MEVQYKLTPGVFYKLVFADGYTLHNGVYKLLRLMTYDESLLEHADLQTSFFEPCGKTASDLNAALPEISKSQIMRLWDPNDEVTEVWYAPTCFLAYAPDHNVAKYTRFGIVAELGIQKDTADIECARVNLIEQMQAALGLDIKPYFVSLSSVWLSDTEYQEELALRDETKKKLINYYTECQRLRTALDKANMNLQAYEEIIRQQEASIADLKTRLLEGH